MAVIRSGLLCPEPKNEIPIPELTPRRVAKVLDDARSHEPR